jgi:asparagine synthase (glutamine-hydrolysing)
MCGILGTLPAITSDLLQKGLNQIAHRGPDGQGIWVDDDHHVALAHRRLSILDLSDAGKQPMEFENLVITFNGEVFNYIEIKRQLQEVGYKFNTETDTEVILKAYHHWGDSCFHRFNGMWALGIYDRQRKSLVLCRDRYGEKPLYYFNKKSLFVFGSEVKAIHTILGSNHPINEDVIQELCKGINSWHGMRETYLKDVNVLPAGHLLHFKQSTLTVTPWYTLPEISVPSSFEEQARVLRELIVDSCMLRLRSDVPVGTCLSGGLDSGSITGVLHNTKTAQYTHRSFCASFPNTPIDEAAKARRIAEQLGSRLDVVNIVPPTPNELENAMKGCDGPMHALAFYPIWKLYQYIRNQNVVVTLDGQGPDEMLGGYRPLVAAIQYAFRNAKPGYLMNVYRTYRDLGESAQVSSKAIARDALVGSLKAEVRRLVKNFVTANEPEVFAHPFHSNPFDEELYRQFFKDPLPGILMQYDRCSMAHGVECRMPFMDYRVVEFVFSLPLSSRVGGGYTKRVLREAMKGVVPDETRLDKQKIGFNAPIVDWYRGPLHQWMADQMNSQQFLNESLFNGRELLNEFEKFCADPSPQWDSAWKFWGPIHYIWWKNKYKA